MEMVKNNEINISPANWQKLNKSHTKDEIKQLISDAIGENDLPMPMRKMTKAAGWQPRRHQWTPRRIANVVRRLTNGEDLGKIAKDLRIQRQSLRRTLQRHGVEI